MRQPTDEYRPDPFKPITVEAVPAPSSNAKELSGWNRWTQAQFLTRASQYCQGAAQVNYANAKLSEDE